MCAYTGPYLMGGTMALCQGPGVSKGPRAPAADCCKKRNHAPCMIVHCFLETCCHKMLHFKTKMHQIRFRRWGAYSTPQTSGCI